MPSSVTDDFIPGLAAGAASARKASYRRRYISPSAGRALEILGHAIEYLADEYVHEGGLFSAQDPRVEAIQLLMARNREIYFACPQVPTIAERLLAWLHRHSRFLLDRVQRQPEH